jgi:hypothetical protein
VQGTSRSAHTPSRKALLGDHFVGTISDTWILPALHSNSRRVEVVGKFGMLAGPVFMLVYFLFYAQWWCVFAVHQKSGRHASPRLKVVGQTFPSIHAEGLAIQGERAVCAAVFAFTSQSIPSTASLVGT